MIKRGLVRLKFSQKITVICHGVKLLQREVGLVLELSHSGLLALIANFSQATAYSLALIVDATDGNICALAVAFFAVLARTGLPSDSSELGHSLGVLKVVV